MEDNKLNIKGKRTKTTFANSKQNFLTSFYKKYFEKPFVAGISGFVLFFVFTTTIDFLVNIFNHEKSLSVNVLTIVIASTGFVLAFAFKLLEIIKKN